MSYIARKTVFREALNLNCSSKMAIIITRLSDCKENIILIVKIKQDSPTLYDCATASYEEYSEDFILVEEI